MDNITKTEIRRLWNTGEAEICAGMMANSEPWITLQRNFEASLKIISDPAREVYLATLDGKIAGFIILLMHGAFVGYIQSIYVDTRWRNRGIGSQLMDFAEQRIFSESPNAFICVSSFNQGALRLYKRLGYEVVGELKDYILAGQSEVLLRKTVAPLTEFKKRVRVVPHNPAWKRAFQVEAAQIAQALGNLEVIQHHIGSTAISGIFAKPIIDILLEVENIFRLDDKTPAMEGLGYEAMGEYGIPGRRYFRKENASGIRTHHVHAFQADSPEIERHIAFRDYMVAHPQEAQRYGVLKRKLAGEHPDDIQAYMDGKDAYIKEQEAKALAWRASQGAR